MGLTRQRSRVDGHQWYRSILIGTVITSCTSLLFQFIGFVTPGWIVLSTPTGLTVNAGVWYIQVCSSQSCHTASMTAEVNPFKLAGDKADFINWMELQVELTLAFISCIACVVMSINSLLNMSEAPMSYLGVGCGTAVASGLLLIPVCRLGVVIREWDSHIAYTTPYSLIASTLGSTLLFITLLLDLCAICMIMTDLRRERRLTEERADLTACNS